MSQLYCIVLAGGSGSRLWPVSREASPKQMLKFNDDYSLFQRNFLNISTVLNDRNIITTANVKYASNIKSQLKELQEKFGRKFEYKMITEPVVKNTAGAVTLAAKFIEDNYKYFSGESPIIIVVPSDEIFPNREILADTLEQGVELAKNGYIVTFGTQVFNADEYRSYFKIRKSATAAKISPLAHKISEFVKKVQKKDSAELQIGKLYANTGIYMFSYNTFISELNKSSKELSSFIENRVVTSAIPSVALDEYEKLPDIPIEDILIENTKKVAFLKLDMQWNDIGSWDAVYNISKKDDNGNALTGKVIDIDSKNSLVYSTDKLVATLGLKDMIVVSTEDASFICDRKNPNAIKKIYKKLNEKNSAIKETHKTVLRPWGYYTVLENGDGFLTKCITVNPQAKLSLQKHFHRSEHWIVLEGEAVVIKDKETIVLKSGESIDIAVEEIHSLQNNGTEQLKILEVQQGDILDENDIERIEDIYGRV